MVKGSGVWLGEEEGAGPNKPAKDDLLPYGQGDWELLGRSVELGGTGWGDVGQREVGWGDWELLEGCIKLDGDRRSLKVKEEVRRSGQQEVRRGDWELLGRSIELNGTGWGDDGR